MLYLDLRRAHTSFVKKRLLGVDSLTTHDSDSYVFQGEVQCDGMDDASDI